MKTKGDIVVPQNAIGRLTHLVAAAACFYAVVAVGGTAVVVLALMTIGMVLNASNRLPP